MKTTHRAISLRSALGSALLALTAGACGDFGGAATSGGETQGPGTVFDPTNIPDRKDNLTSGSFGMKWSPRSNLLVIANAIVAFNNGGIRADVVPTLGLDTTSSSGGGIHPGRIQLTATSGTRPDPAAAGRPG